MMCGKEPPDQDLDDKQLDLSGGGRSLLGRAPPVAAPKETSCGPLSTSECPIPAQAIEKTASGGGVGLGLLRSDGSLGMPDVSTGYGSMGWWTSNVASAQEVEAVSRVVGYPARTDQWRMCYNVDADTKTSQAFHRQCDKVRTAFVSLFLSLAPLNAYMGFGHFNATAPPKHPGVHLDAVTRLNR